VELNKIGTSVSQNTDFLSILKDFLPTIQGIASAHQDQQSLTSQRHDELSSVVNEVLETNLEICRLVLEMQTSLPQQVGCQQPLYFTDACGFRAKLDLGYFDSWEAFNAVIGVKFKQRGLRVVEKKQYVLEDAHRKKLINTARPFQACFVPGQQVNMDACFDENIGTEKCCPGCQHVENVASDQAIDW